MDTLGKRICIHNANIIIVIYSRRYANIFVLYVYISGDLNRIERANTKMKVTCMPRVLLNNKKYKWYANNPL